MKFFIAFPKAHFLCLYWSSFTREWEANYFICNMLLYAWRIISSVLITKIYHSLLNEGWKPGIYFPSVISAKKTDISRESFWSPAIATYIPRPVGSLDEKKNWMLNLQTALKRWDESYHKILIISTAHTHFHTTRLFKQLVLFGVIQDTVCIYLHLGFFFICGLMEIKPFVGSFLELSPAWSDDNSKSMKSSAPQQP